MDIVLINPGDRKAIFQGLGDEFVSIEPPVFCGLFATFLRLKGCTVAIYDAVRLNTSARETAQAVADMKPTLAVLVVYGAQPSASTQNMTAAANIAAALNEIAPEFPNLVTGPHVAALPEQTLLEEPGFDAVCDGEGPITIFKAFEALKNHSSGYGIPNLWIRGEGFVGTSISKEPLIQTLDTEMPGIAYDLQGAPSLYRSHTWHSFGHLSERSPYAAIHTSLGCPFACHFCMINAPHGKPSYRMWSPEIVVEEIDYLAREHGVYNIKFVDEMFLLNPNHVNEICRLLIEREYKVNIWAYARVDTVEKFDLGMLREAGIRWLCLGIESASQHVREGALKRYGNDDIIQVVKKIQAAGINVIGNFIFGLPDDTEERMVQTLNLALELKCEYANFYSAMAYPGSPLYAQAVKEERRLPEKWEDFSQHGYGCVPLANDFCTSEEILNFRDLAFTHYFKNPGYLDSIRRKFGQAEVDHIGRMVAVPLKRRILGD